MKHVKDQLSSTPPRGVIKSKDIARTLQQELGIEGRIVIKQVRGGRIEFSINSKDEQKLLNFFAKVPSYREDLYLKEKRSDGKFTTIVTESFFRLRLLAYLYLRGKEQAQTIELADMIDKLTGVEATYSSIENLRPVVESVQWDLELFKMLDEESLLCSHVRKFVQAHTIVTMDQQPKRFQPTPAKVIPVDENKSAIDDELDFVLEVVPEDCLTTAYKLFESGHSVCVLNMANQKHPGGGYSTGEGHKKKIFVAVLIC